MKIVSKLMIAVLLVDYVGQVSVTFFAACSVPDAVITISSHAMDSSQHASLDNNAQGSSVGDDKSDGQCQEHTCGGALAEVITSALITQIFYVIATLHDGEHHPLFRPPIFA